MSQGFVDPPSERPRPTMADVLLLPDGQRGFVLWLVRREEATLAEALAEVGPDESAGRALLDALVAGGYLQESRQDGAAVFRTSLSSRRGRQVPSDVWKNLEV